MRCGACDVRDTPQSFSAGERPACPAPTACQTRGGGRPSPTPSPPGATSPLALFFQPQTHAHYKEVRQHHQRHRMMPSGPTADCIIAHPQQLLAVCTAGFDGPPPPAHPHACFQGGRHWGSAQGGLQRARLDVPTQHHPDLRARHGVPHGDPPQRGTLCHHGPLAAFLDRLAGPRLGGPRRSTLPHRPRLWGAFHQAFPLWAASAPPPRRLGALPRRAWCGALRHKTTRPPPPPPPARPGGPHTPRPPRPTDTAGTGSSRSRRASPGPTWAWV